MKTPHEHAELIKAWADGAEIEYHNGGGRLITTSTPNGLEVTTYRIKPEHDVVLHCYIDEHGLDMLSDRLSTDDNLKLTFNGKTGKLKSAEVI